MDTSNIVMLVGFLTLCGSGHSNANKTIGTDTHSVVGDFHDLLDLIPYEPLVSLYVTHAVEDNQTRKVLRYLRSDCFKANLKALQQRREFNETAELLEPLGLNLHQTLNQFNRQLTRYQQLSNSYVRDPVRELPDGISPINLDGLLGLIEQTVEILPVQEIKEVYKEKLDNFQFRTVVEQRHILKEYLLRVVATEECEFISNQLIGMGVPLKDITAFLEEEITNFFDLEYVSDTETSSEYDEAAPYTR